MKAILKFSIIFVASWDFMYILNSMLCDIMNALLSKKCSNVNYNGTHGGGANDDNCPIRGRTVKILIENAYW